VAPCNFAAPAHLFSNLCRRAMGGAEAVEGRGGAGQSRGGGGGGGAGLGGGWPTAGARDTRQGGRGRPAVAGARGPGARQGRPAGVEDARQQMQIRWRGKGRRVLWSFYTFFYILTCTQSCFVKCILKTISP
jgi:hypothetical protein